MWVRDRKYPEAPRRVQNTDNEADWTQSGPSARDGRTAAAGAKRVGSELRRVRMKM